MADIVQTRSMVSEQNEKFVVRRFLGARIERLLLTRLFDLTTGLGTSEELNGVSSRTLSNQQENTAVSQQREAA